MNKKAENLVHLTIKLYPKEQILDLKTAAMKFEFTNHSLCLPSFILQYSKIMMQTESIFLTVIFVTVQS